MKLRQQRQLKVRRKLKVRKHQLYHQTQVQLVGLQHRIEKEKGSVHIAHMISMSMSRCQQRSYHAGTTFTHYAWYYFMR